MRIRMVAAAAACLGTLATAAQAHAATVAVNGLCFIEGQPLTAAAAGFTPGGQVNFSFDGVLADSALADGAGNITEPLVAPSLGGRLQHTFSLAAQDTSNPALAATTKVNVTAVKIQFKPNQARPSHKVRFVVHGWLPGGTLYLHYVFHRHAKATRKLGKPKPPCGTLSKRQRFFPMRHPHTGTWTFQYDNKRKYSKATRPAYIQKVLIFRTFR